MLFSTFVEQFSREKGTKEDCNEGGENSPDKPAGLGAGRSCRRAGILLVTGKSNYMVSRWKYLPQKLGQRLTAKIGFLNAKVGAERLTAKIGTEAEMLSGCFLILVVIFFLNFNFNACRFPGNVIG